MQSGSISLSLRNPRDAAQEARRVSRAREIAPGMFADQSTAPAPADPFDNQPVTSSPPASPIDDASGLDHVAAGRWQTVIVRGHASETKSFPLPDTDTTHADEDSLSTQQ